jgi:hypothetical protein
MKAIEIKEILTEASNKISECTTRKFKLRIDYEDAYLFAKAFILFLETEKIVTRAALVSSSRKKSINFKRQSLAKILVEHEHLSSTKIGELLNRTHSTIIHYANSNSHFFKAEFDEIFNMYEVFIEKYYSTGKC